LSVGVMGGGLSSLVKAVLRRCGVAMVAGAALFCAVSTASADCTTNGTTVTCTSAGGTQTAPVGTGAEDGYTVNVQSGATVDVSGSPGAVAIDLNDANTVNNAGSVIAGDGTFGISVNNGSSITNSGSVLVGNNATAINACCDNIIVNSGSLTAGDNGFGVFASDGNTFTNSGTISVGNSSAGVLINDNNTISNRGTISAGTNGAGISANDGNTITNAGSITVGDGFGSYGIAAVFNNVVVNSGTVTVGIGGTGIAIDANTALPVFNSFTNSGSINIGNFGIGVIITDNHRALNSGTISTGNFGIGLQAFNNNIVTNTGTITVGTSGSGIQFRGTGSVLDNFGTIRATGGGFSIDACSCSAVSNAFNNKAGGTLDGYMNVDGIGNTVTNSGLITITDPAAPLIGYPTFLLANTSLAGAGNAFVQTATGTLALRMDNTGLIDNLSADAITARGTLKIVIQNQLYANTTFSGTGVGLTVYGAGTLGNTITSGFDHYVASSPFFTVTPIYDSGDPTNYTSLTFQLDRLGFGSVAGATHNQTAVGNVLEAGYSTGLTGALATFYSNLLAATSLGVLDQLSGAGTAAAQDGAFTAGSQFGNAMFQQGMNWLNGTPGGSTFTFGAPLGYAAVPPRNKLAGKPGYDAFAAMPRDEQATQGRWRAWTAGFGGTRSVDGQAGTANQTTTNFGGAFGVDRQFTPDFLLGIAVGGSGSNFSASSLSTSGRINAGHVGAYAIQRIGAAYVAATMNYARGETTTERTITGVGTTETAKGRFASDQLSGRIEIGRKYGFRGYSLTPFAAIEPAVLWQNAYAETSTTAAGAPGTLGLSYQSNTVTSLPVFLGAQLDTRYVLANGRTLSPFARLSWVHEFKPERSIQASFISIPGAAFTVDGARAGADALRLETGGTLSLGRSAALFVNLTGEFSSRSQGVAGLGGARMSW
jgi:outer membrane autotransporter protein